MQSPKMFIALLVTQTNVFFLPNLIGGLSERPLCKSIDTGYNQSVTGCGSQRRHVVVTQRKLM